VLLEEYIINDFYIKKRIWRDFHVSSQGGIRPNISENLVVVFLDAPTPNPKPGQAHNIYQDRYDPSAGVYYYTGAGQEGDQKHTGPNARLINSNKDKTTIHFFRQYNLSGLHQYIGKVKVVKISQATQPDVHGKNRRVFVFSLQPESDFTVLPIFTVKGFV